MVKNMRNKIVSSLLALCALAGTQLPGLAYPERPDAARVQYEMWYFPVRCISMVCATAWDIPTACFQDSVKGAIGGTKMVARNLGKEDGVYEMLAAGPTGGAVGAAGGAAYGVIHGFGYGVAHGFCGYTSPHSGSHSMLFQGKSFVVPYDDNY